MTRVLLVHQPPDGGVARHIRDLANGLSERGHEVAVCGPRPVSGVVANVDYSPLDLTRAIAPRVDAATIAALAKLVGKLRPDVMHAHSSKAGAVARLARTVHPRTPLVYSPHLYAFAGYFERPSERRVYRAVEQMLAPLASRVICVCEDEARLARTIGPSSRVRVIYNGVPTQDDGPIDPRVAELGTDGEAIVGTVALLHPRKGLETLIRALPAVLEHQPRTRLVVAGDGPQLQELRDLARRLDVATAVSFIGPTADPIGVVRGFDVFVLPSWAESFPYVILEAMSLGRPILACDVGGVGEAVLAGESGLIVPPRDTQALASGMAELLADPSLRRRLGGAALKCQRELFTLDTMVEKTIAVYDELIARRNPRKLG